ncbi:MAG: metallophosphoesterase [Rhodococcus sp. (in: high G+C Gram-positive bacteria)]|uniref:metallophosphoesterase family protein n=1 Tax=Rhodococcus sp. TaxID=1831 RepID=UPI003BB494B0
MAVAGDWHGSTSWARRALEQVAGHGVRTVLHVGDFGIWYGVPGRHFLDTVTDICSALDLTIYITPGNHEHWPTILSSTLEARDEFGSVMWIRNRIAVLPRGHRFHLGDRSFVSLGGAPSIDFQTRFPGIDWWPDEMITPEDIAAVVAGGHADVMLAHDAPDTPWQTGKVAAICASNPGGWPALARGYSAVGRTRLSTAFLAVRPEVYVHGHYHVADDIDLDLGDRRCRMVSLDCEWTAGNLAYLELPDLSVTTRPPA